MFFAQLVEELLFDYTLDTYKIPAMNTHTLFVELCQTIDDIESGVIRRGAIRPIIEELCDGLVKDTVATNLFTNIRDELLSSLNKIDNIAEVKTRANLVKNRLDKKYLDETKKLLRDAVVDGKQKEKIISLTRTLVAEWIHLGYSSEYIYFQTIDFFFEGKYPEVIDKASQIDDYFNTFTTKNLNLMAIYRVSSNFLELKEFLAKQDMTIQSDVPSFKLIKSSGRVTEFMSENESSPLFLTLKRITAFDVFKAKEDADDTLQLLDSLARYHVHRLDLSWSDEALICSEDGRSFGVYKKPVPPTLKRPDEEIHNLSGLMSQTVLTVASENLDRESLSRFIRAFRRHDMAIRSTAPRKSIARILGCN